MTIRKFRHHTEALTPANVRRSQLVANVRALLLVGLAGIALTGVGIGVLRATVGVAAQTPAAGAKEQQYCRDFVGHLSADLGVRSSRLQAAMAKAANQTVQDAATHGDLTAQQANAIKARIPSQAICATSLSEIGEPMDHRLLLNAVASALGTTPAHLRTQLAQGKTVSQIAPSGMTEQQFASALESDLKRQLDTQVRAGNLTPAQENQALSHVPAVAQTLWTKGAPMMSPGTTGSTVPPSGAPTGP